MDDSQFFKAETERNIFLQILERYTPFWPLFVITTALSLSVTFVYLRSQVRIYLSSAKVLLKDPNKGSGDSKILDALNIFGDKKIVENEIVVLRSTNLMQEVVKDLHLYSTVYNEGKVRVDELYKENSPVWFQTLYPETSSGSKKLYFIVDWNKNQIVIDDKIVKFNDSTVLNNTIYRVIPNEAYNKTLKGKNYFVQFNSVSGAAGNIINDLKVNAISSQSTVIELKLETQVPEKGNDILTKLFEVYNAFGIADKNQTAAKTLAFIDTRLNIVTSQLDSVEKHVERYKSQNQVLDLSKQGQIYLETMKDYDKTKSQIEIKLDVLNDVSRYINGKSTRSDMVPSLALLDDPTLAGLLDKLYDATFALEKSKSVAGPESDAVLLGEQQVDRLKSAIRENVNNIRRNLLYAQRNVSSNIQFGSNFLNQIPEKERGLIDVTRQQAIKNNIYSYLLQRREETALNSASTIADLRIIEKAAAYGPIKPISRNYYVTGFIIGIMLALFIILISEQVNRKVLFTSEIESKTKVPIVGEIMQVKSKTPFVIKEGKRTVIAEQFRSLRTNLSFMALSEDAKTTLITSNISGEGKSFISINLAISYTLTNKRVALLELDLRRPKLSLLLNVNRDPGISNYLVGKLSIEEIIKETTIKNLFIISAGAIPPNPSELILSNKFKVMMDELKQRFDYLIIDSAPIGPVSDSLLLKEYANTTIFVVRHNHTPKMYLKLIDNLFTQSKFPNMCIVFNGLKRRGIAGNYGYGTYGYGNYGFGYGYDKYSQDYYIKEEKNSVLSSIKNIFRK